MKCIFCLEDKPGTVEHVFPRAIGGNLKINRLCKSCNSKLGAKADPAISDNFLVRIRRSELNLAGNSGKSPGKYELIEGVARLASNPNIRVRVSLDRRLNKIDLQVISEPNSTISEDGIVNLSYQIDPRDSSKIPQIIARERKRIGLMPLNEDDLLEAARNTQLIESNIENPRLIYEISHDFTYVRHGLLKIAYELAFIWLGEEYIYDDLAAHIRNALLSEDSNATSRLPIHFIEDPCGQPLDLWSDNRNSHFAFSSFHKDGICIVVRIFDLHAAAIWVSNSTERYLRHFDSNKVEQFIWVDPLTRSHRVTSLQEEMRIVTEKLVRKANFEKGL